MLGFVYSKAFRKNKPIFITVNKSLICICFEVNYLTTRGDTRGSWDSGNTTISSSPITVRDNPSSNQTNVINGQH